MDQIFEDWEIVSKTTHRRWAMTFWIVLVGLLIQDTPPFHSSVTWTVRQKSTGTIRGDGMDQIRSRRKDFRGQF
jgi:hypothetical protein